MDTLDERNKQLDERIDNTDLPTAINTLLRDAKSRRRQIKLLALTVVFDVLLTLGFGYITIRTHYLATKSESNTVAIQRSCQSTNESRANNKRLWEYILALPPSQTRTPDQDQRLVDFRAFLDKTFAQKDCSKITE